MSQKKTSSGTIHKTPDDLRQALIATKGAQQTWESITPLARNEWICWVISGKKQRHETSVSRKQSQNSKMECVGRVAGRAVPIENKNKKKKARLSPF